MNWGRRPLSAPAFEIQTQIREGGPRGWAAATKRTGGARGYAASSRTIGVDRRSGSVGLGDRRLGADACDRQITHRAQSCAGWSGFCCAGCAPSPAWQIGTSPAGPALMSSGASEIVARRRIWHQTASSDAANPTVGFSLWRETALRLTARRTGLHSNCQSGMTSVAACRRQAIALPSWRRPNHPNLHSVPRLRCTSPGSGSAPASTLPRASFLRLGRKQQRIAFVSASVVALVALASATSFV